MNLIPIMNIYHMKYEEILEKVKKSCVLRRYFDRKKLFASEYLTIKLIIPNVQSITYHRFLYFD